MQEDELDQEEEDEPDIMRLVAKRHMEMLPKLPAPSLEMFSATCLKPPAAFCPHNRRKALRI
jgi:hypothetical protein